jgi:hypothetical protein
MRRTLSTVLVAAAALAVIAPAAALAHGSAPKGGDPGTGAPTRDVAVVVRGLATANATPTAVQIDPRAGGGRWWRGSKGLRASGPVTIPIDAGTRIRKVGWASANFANLLAGDRLVAVLVVPKGTSPGALPAADAIVDLGPAPQRLVHFEVWGTLAADAGANATQVTVNVQRADRDATAALAGATSVTVKIDPKLTTIHKRGIGNETTADLKAGDRVKVEWKAPAGTTAGNLPAATRIKDHGPPPPVRLSLRGTAAANASATELKVNVQGANWRLQKGLAGATSISVKLDATATRIHKRGVATATFADLLAGDRVKVVWWVPQGTTLANLPAAAKVLDHGPPPPVRYEVRGLVAGDAAQSGVQVTIVGGNRRAGKALAGKGSAFVKLDAGTRIWKRGAGAVDWTRLKSGDRVRVAIWAAKDLSWDALPAARRVHDRGPAFPTK